MRFDIMTLFPEAVDAMMQSSILGRAQKKGLIEIHTHQIRDYTTNKQNQVDDYPYGGGRGAVMQCDPLYRCWAAICDELGAPAHTIYLSPCGAVFQQEKAKQLAGKIIRISARGAEGGRLYGSVTSQEIAAALEKQYGVKVEKRRIEVANIRNAGDFTVSVWLYAGVTAEMTAKVEVIKG